MIINKGEEKMEHRNNTKKSAIEDYVEKGLEPKFSMADYLNNRYVDYVLKEVGISGKYLKGTTIKERLLEIEPLVKEKGLQTKQNFTKNQNNKLKKILKFFLGENALRLLKTDKNRATSGYLLSRYDAYLLDLLLDVLGTSNECEIAKKFNEYKELKEYIYKGFCTWSENKTNHLTKDFVDKRWCILFNERYKNVMEALEDLKSTIKYFENIPADVECNMKFWDYVKEQIEEINEKVKAEIRYDRKNICL